MKKHWVIFFAGVLGLVMGTAVYAASSKKVNPPTARVDQLGQCVESGKDKPDPLTWSKCCKSHGGKVKGSSWNCDEESAAKAKEKSKLEDDISSSEEDLDESISDEDEDNSQDE